MRVLITGGAGFIGGHLAERLVQQGHEVHIVDRKPVNDWPYYYPGASADCRELWLYGVSKYPFDFIYHLAATVGVRRVLENPAECIDNNVRSLQAVLSLGIPGIFASTSEVYGLTKGALSESSELRYSSQSRWAYAASKLIGEHLARQAGWKTVRFFNVVGPRQNSDYGAVLPSFVGQALQGEPITVYGDGSQTRTFLDVRDCAAILDTLRDREFDVVNVGGEQTLSIRHLAEFVRDAVSSRSDIVHVPYESAYPPGFEECKERVPDLSKLRSLIGEFEYRSFYQTVSDLAESLKEKYEPVCG